MNVKRIISQYISTLKRTKAKENKIKDKSITQNLFTIQFSDSIMYKFYCITFIYDCMENFVRLNQLMFI